MMMDGEARPWGSFHVIHEDIAYKIKVLEILPGKRLSYQKHSRRSERWTVVEGNAIVIIEGIESDLTVGDMIMIETGQKHRIENRSDITLKIVEVQIGDYFGEDDIERFDDDYGRI